MKAISLRYTRYPDSTTNYRRVTRCVCQTESQTIARRAKTQNVSVMQLLARKLLQ